MSNPYRHPISTPVPELQGIASIAAPSPACDRTPMRKDAVGEPVAWMYECRDAYAHFHKYRNADGYGKNWTETPLFASPTPTPVEEPAKGAVEPRQYENMAWVLNHVTLPDQWYEKFTQDLAEDRAALAATNAGQAPSPSNAVAPASDEQVEAMARLLYFDHVDQHGYPNGLLAWDELPERVERRVTNTSREYWRSIADAALTKPAQP